MNNSFNNKKPIIIIICLIIILCVGAFIYFKVIKANKNETATKFEATVYVLSKDEGGSQTSFFNNYRPRFYFETTDITGTITLPDNIEYVEPGETTNMTVELISPIAMEIGTEFSIKEGGRTVGRGTVTKIY